MGFSESLIETMIENTELTSKVIRNIAIFKDNPDVQKQMEAMSPILIRQLGRPEVLKLMTGETGKKALNAIHKIQTALQRLQMVTPDLFDILGMSKLAAGISIWGTSSSGMEEEDKEGEEGSDLSTDKSTDVNVSKNGSSVKEEDNKKQVHTSPSKEKSKEKDQFGNEGKKKEGDNPIDGGEKKKKKKKS